MIVSFKHRGLGRSYEAGTTRGIQTIHGRRIRMILARLEASITPEDMNLPALNLDELSGKRRGTWSARVSGNWRITFRFEGPDAHDIDLEDYH